MGYYLQVGSLIISNGSDDSSGYCVTGHPRFPEPEPDEYGGHKPAKREFSVRCTGSTASAAAYRAEVLRRECVKDKTLYFRHGATGQVLSSRIQEATVSEDEYAPIGRDAFGVTLDASLTTDPYWLGEWSATTSASASVTDAFDSFDIADPGGEVDALVNLRVVTTSSSASRLYIGVKPEPNASYSFADQWVTDMSGTSSYQPFAGGLGPFSLNPNDNRGRHLLLARLGPWSGSGANGYFYGATTTTGGGISTAVTVNEVAVVSGAGGAEARVYELGTMQLPSGQIPSIEAVSGYGVEEVSASNTTASAWTASASSWTASQSFPISAPCIHTGFSCYANITTGSGQISWQLYSASGDVPAGYSPTPLAYGTTPRFTGSGVVRCSWDVPVTLQPGNYVVATEAHSHLYGELVTVKYSTASAYAGGKACINSTTPSSSADLYFLSHSQPALAFTSRNTIYMKDASGTQWTLDWVARLPVDYAALIYRETASGTMGLYYDGDTDTPYAADSDGIGPAVYDKCEIRAPLRVRPGVTNRVVVCISTVESAVQGVSTLTYQTRPRYLTATG